MKKNIPFYFAFGGILLSALGLGAALVWLDLQLGGWRNVALHPSVRIGFAIVAFLFLSLIHI